MSNPPSRQLVNAHTDAVWQMARYGTTGGVANDSFRKKADDTAQALLTALEHIPAEPPPAQSSKEKLRPGIWIGAVWFPLKAKPSRWDLFWVWFCNGWKYEERA